MKKILAMVAALAIGGTLLCTACSPFAKVYESDGSIPSDIATERGENGSAANWLASLETPSSRYRVLYEEAVKDGSFTGTYFEFLKELGVEDGSGAYVQEALRTVVTVECAYGSGNNMTYSYGSGVFYEVDTAEGDAYVITNYHVVYNVNSSGREKVAHISDDINLYLYGGETKSRAIDATYVGGVMDNDIAVLRVEDSDALKGNTSVEAIVAADSDSVKPGEPVYAIGNGEVDGMAVSQGIVSVDAEYIEIKSADESKTIKLLEIRTDASVNHGNSGGGLFNADGKLIGIVNARNEEEGVVGFGYAIPANLALSLAQNIIDSAAANNTTKGAVVARLGIEVEVSDSHAVFDETTGCYLIEEKVTVKSVEVGSAAIRAGLAVGDTVLSAKLTSTRGGTAYERTVEVTRMHKLTNLMPEVRFGDTLELSVSRSGKVQTVTVVYDAGGYFKTLS